VVQVITRSLLALQPLPLRQAQELIANMLRVRRDRVTEAAGHLWQHY